MQTRLLNPGPPRVWAAVLETGEEVVQELTAFARRHRLVATQISAIGAFRSAVLGYFEFSRKDYRRIVVDEQCEVLSLLGDFALDGGEPRLHAHVVLGRSDGSTRGGHLLEARVRPTLEVLLTESPGHLRREFDPDSGIALIRTGETA